MAGHVYPWSVSVRKLDAGLLKRRPQSFDRRAAWCALPGLELQDRVPSDVGLLRQVRGGPPQKRAGCPTLVTRHDLEDITCANAHAEGRECAKWGTKAHNGALVPFSCKLPHMSIIPSHTEEQLEILELFDRSLDNALAAGVHPACLHDAIDSRVTRLRLIEAPALKPIGWRTIAGVRVDPSRDMTLGTPRAHDEIFCVSAPTNIGDAATRLSEFRSSVTRTLEHWPREDLHRCVDAAHWLELAELFQRAGDHAWRAKISGPRPHAA